MAVARAVVLEQLGGAIGSVGQFAEAFNNWLVGQFSVAPEAAGTVTLSTVSKVAVSIMRAEHPDDTDPVA
jgi:hypothetical protein